VTELANKYLKTMEWNIPETGEGRARWLILHEIRQAPGRMENPV
jgi:hypothetical protein